MTEAVTITLRHLLKAYPDAATLKDAAFKQGYCEAIIWKGDLEEVSFLFDREPTVETFKQSLLDLVGMCEILEGVENDK